MSNTYNILASDVEALLETAGQTIFTVTFRKRTTGEIRVMNCRRGVKKYLKGGKATYNPKEHDLMFVYDVQKPEGQGYRSISLNTVINIKLRGNVYNVVQ